MGNELRPQVERPTLCKIAIRRQLKGMQDYNNKLLEFAHANTKAAFDFAQRMSGVKSPSEFVELSTEHAQQQLTTLTEQTKQLAALAQQTTLATVEPLKTSLVPTST